MKVAATRLGLTLADYQARLDSGMKHCTKCKQWRSSTNFTADTSRSDGLDATCVQCRRVKIHKTTKGRPPYFKGHHHTEYTKQLISQRNKGKRPRLGKHLTDAQRKHVSDGTTKYAARGPKNPRWKGGISPATQKARYSFEMKEWRRQVFERDHFICQRCGYTNGHILIAHHVRAFSEYPELRLDVSNGLTLCKPCHDALHSV